MDTSKVKKQCQPCKCGRSHSTPSKKHYFYTEKTTFQEATGKKSNLRPSSADSAKSQKSFVSWKAPSSDSKIPKQTFITRTKIKKKGENENKLDPQSVKQLKDDLETIKKQLFLLTKNNADSLQDDQNETYKQLLNKSHEQEIAIGELKTENDKLLDRWKLARNTEGVNMKDVVTTKLCLDRYEQKLNHLYEEFLHTSKVMQESRKRFCRCINDKSHEIGEMQKSRNELTKAVESKSAKYDNLMRSYEESVQSERKYREQNKQLIRKVQELENQLHQTMMELDVSRTEGSLKMTRLQEAMNEKTKSYTYELHLKAKEIVELSTAVDELKKHVCSCTNQSDEAGSDKLQTEYNQLFARYKQVLETLNNYEKNIKKRVEEIQALRNKEKGLIAKFAKLQQFLQELTTISDQNKVTIAELTSANQEKNSIIQCQKVNLASKDKQIAVMAKNEERLMKRVVQLQEDLVNVRVSSCQERSNFLAPSDDGSIHLTDELQDLISALYEEIDKTLAKDEEIEKHKRSICCLQCTLSAKEKELVCLRNELRILRDQFCTTMKEKQQLVDQIEKMEEGESEFDTD